MLHRLVPLEVEAHYISGLHISDHLANGYDSLEIVEGTFPLGNVKDKATWGCDFSYIGVGCRDDASEKRSHFLYVKCHVYLFSFGITCRADFFPSCPTSHTRSYNSLLRFFLIGEGAPPERISAAMFSTSFCESLLR